MKQPFNGKALGEQVVAAVKTYVARAAARSEALLNALDARVLTMVSELEKRIASIPAGPQGERGERGEKGLDGNDGAPGIQGERGASGERGEKGEPGINGKDGAPGINGTNGEAGPRGEKGEPGINGKDGADGINGKDGAPGERGLDGRDGREGKDGAPGKDALEIDPVPSIDVTRSYAAGTWAQYENGLLKATRATDPLEKMADTLFPVLAAGWRVVVAGVSRVKWEMLDDGRTLEVRTQFTGGSEEAQRFAVPAMVYRDVWQSSIEYAQGDTVTRDGSLWCCIVKTTTAQPGASKDWRLIAKRGAHGKDGLPGPQGPRGEPGKRGS